MRRYTYLVNLAKKEGPEDLLLVSLVDFETETIELGALSVGYTGRVVYDSLDKLFQNSENEGGDTDFSYTDPDTDVDAELCNGGMETSADHESQVDACITAILTIAKSVFYAAPYTATLAKNDGDDLVKVTLVDDEYRTIVLGTVEKAYPGIVVYEAFQQLSGQSKEYGGDAPFCKVDPEQLDRALVDPEVTMPENGVELVLELVAAVLTIVRPPEPETN